MQMPVALRQRRCSQDESLVSCDCHESLSDCDRNDFISPVEANLLGWFPRDGLVVATAIHSRQSALRRYSQSIAAVQAHPFGPPIPLDLALDVGVAGNQNQIEAMNLMKELEIMRRPGSPSVLPHSAPLSAIAKKVVASPAREGENARASAEQGSSSAVLRSSAKIGDSPAANLSSAPPAMAIAKAKPKNPSDPAFRPAWKPPAKGPSSGSKTARPFEKALGLESDGSVPNVGSLIAPAASERLPDSFEVDVASIKAARGRNEEGRGRELNEEDGAKGSENAGSDLARSTTSRLSRRSMSFGQSLEAGASRSGEWLAKTAKEGSAKRKAADVVFDEVLSKRATHKLLYLTPTGPANPPITEKAQAAKIASASIPKSGPNSALPQPAVSKPAVARPVVSKSSESKSSESKSLAPQSGASKLEANSPLESAMIAAEKIPVQAAISAPRVKSAVEDLFPSIDAMLTQLPARSAGEDIARQGSQTAPPLRAAERTHSRWLALAKDSPISRGTPSSPFQPLAAPSSSRFEAPPNSILSTITDLFSDSPLPRAKTGSKIWSPSLTASKSVSGRRLSFFKDSPQTPYSQSPNAGSLSSPATARSSNPDRGGDRGVDRGGARGGRSAERFERRLSLFRDPVSSNMQEADRVRAKGKFDEMLRRVDSSSIRTP